MLDPDAPTHFAVSWKGANYVLTEHPAVLSSRPLTEAQMSRYHALCERHQIEAQEMLRSFAEESSG